MDLWRVQSTPALALRQFTHAIVAPSIVNSIHAVVYDNYRRCTDVALQ